MKLPTDRNRWTAKHLGQAETEASNIAKRIARHLWLHFPTAETLEMLQSRFKRAEGHAKMLRYELIIGEAITMPPLKKFSELDTTNRGAPCQEYPGTWIAQYPTSALPDSGNVLDRKGEVECESFGQALRLLKDKLTAYQAQRLEFDTRDFVISWKCSDNDPRVGKVWFTGYYKHGHFNIFGDYRETP